MSDEHYFVSKEILNGKTYSKVNKIGEEDKIIEIAKMLGGVKLTESALANARDMINLTESKKEEIKSKK